jgi:hypothetical protein
MRTLFNLKIEANSRDCVEYLFDQGFVDNIYPFCDWISPPQKRRATYDFWHYQLEAVFRVHVRNDQTNSIYVGTKDGIDIKKLKVKPNEWQLHLLEIFNEMFHHLADKYGWVKVSVSW